MNSRKWWFVALFLVFILGWTLGYLSLPYLADQYQFWLGAASSFIALVIFYTYSKRSERKKRLKDLWSLIVLAVAISAGVFYLYFLIEEQKAVNIESQELLEASYRNEIKLLYAQERIAQRSMVDKSMEEISFEEDSINLTIKALHALTDELRPVEVFVDDAVLTKLSPGRGYLLHRLLDIEMDQDKRAVIVDKVDFSYADLKASDLSGKEFISINLSHSRLLMANLKGSKFIRSNLKESLLSEASMVNSCFRDCNLEKCIMSWSDLEQSDLRRTDLSAANLSNSNLKNSRMDSAVLKWSDLSNSNLSSSSLLNSDLWAADLRSADLSDCKLQNSRLLGANMENCDLSNANIDGSAVSKEWMTNLKEYQPIGLEEILQKYAVVRDSSKRFKVQSYFIKRRSG